MFVETGPLVWSVCVETTWSASTSSTSSLAATERIWRSVSTALKPLKIDRYTYAEAGLIP